MTFIKTLFGVVFSVCAFIGGILLMGLLIFTLSMSITRTPHDPEKETDAIIVLTGGANRVDTGLELFQEGKAEKLLISGVHRDVRVPDILSFWRGPAINIGNIALDTRATSTIENAIYSIEWIRENDIKTIRLVTAYYHMPRAYWHFKYRMPELRITPHGVTPETGPSYLSALLSEYGKLIISFLPQMDQP